MIATCHACNWESLTYVHKGWAEKSADKHQHLYHPRQSNIIAILAAGYRQAPKLPHGSISEDGGDS